MSSNKFYIRLSWLMLLIVALQFNLTSCNDDENGGGMPEITAVRLPDPEKADSTFVKTSPGQLIAIIGRNLQNAHHVYINDQSIYFNPTMNTDHSIMLTIPTEEDGFMLTPWNAELKAEIRVETPGGIATYSFKVLSPKPTAQRIAGVYPREPGDELKLYGKNLLDITRVYMTDRTLDEISAMKDMTEIGGNQVEITGYSLTQNRYLDNQTKTYVTESVMTFTLPTITYETGSVVVECEAGVAAAEYATLPPRPVLTGISTDMPIPGAAVTLRGTNFIQVEAVKYGDITIPGDQLTVAESEDAITFTMGAKPAAATSTLTVITPGGETEMKFYEYERLLVDFDNRGVDMKWDPNATYQEADGTNPPYVSDGKFALMNVQDNGWNWWGTMIYWQANAEGTPFTLPSYDLIPANTPADQVYLAVECYNINAPFTGSAMIHYQLQTANAGESVWENFDWGTNKPMEPVLADIEGNTPLNQWYRAVLPFGKFGIYSGKTYKDIVESGITTIRLMDMNWAGDPMLLNVCFDNIRVVTK